MTKLLSLIKPAKAKLFLDFLLTSVFFIIILLIPSGMQKAFLGLSANSMIFNGLVSLAVGFVVYYPMSCGLIFIYKKISGKEKKSGAFSLIVAILLILIFNPVSISCIYSGALYTSHNVINTPCGMQITEFLDNSPSQSAGMSVGDIIIKIDTTAITDSGSFFKAVESINPGDTATIKTNSAEYRIITSENPDNHKAYFGIKVKESYCRK